MYVIAIDVGESTGWVYAKLVDREFPEILVSTTIQYENKKMSEALEIADTFSSGLIVDQIIMELPFLTKLNHQPKTIEIMRNRWVSWVQTAFKGIPILQISPSDWKPMPSAKVDMYGKQVDEKWHAWGPTRHEKDAAAMIHWFAVWKLGRT